MGMTMSQAPRMYELIRHEDGDWELVATGTAEKLAADRLDLLADIREAEPGWSGHYAVTPADLNGCEIGSAGGICPVSVHVTH